jgi:chromosome segregation ATPase
MLDDINMENDSIELLRKKYELVRVVCKFVFESQPDEVILQALLEKDELDLLFYDISGTVSFLNQFIQSNIGYLEKALEGGNFSETVQEQQKVLSESIIKLQNLKEDLKRKREYEDEILQKKGEIARYENDIAELEKFLKKYEGKSVVSLKERFDELHTLFFEKYQKSLEDAKQEFASWEESIAKIKEFEKQYASNKEELEHLEKEYTHMKEKFEKDQKLLNIYRDHFDANLRLKYDSAQGIEKTIEEALQEFDEYIRDSMLAIKKIQESIREKQK